MLINCARDKHYLSQRIIKIITERYCKKDNIRIVIAIKLCVMSMPWIGTINGGIIIIFSRQPCSVIRRFARDYLGVFRFGQGVFRLFARLYVLQYGCVFACVQTRRVGTALNAQPKTSSSASQTEIKRFLIIMLLRSFLSFFTYKTVFAW